MHGSKFSAHTRTPSPSSKFAARPSPRAQGRAAASRWYLGRRGGGRLLLDGGASAVSAARRHSRGWPGSAPSRSPRAPPGACWRSSTHEGGNRPVLLLLRRDRRVAAQQDLVEQREVLRRADRLAVGGRLRHRPLVATTASLSTCSPLTNWSGCCESSSKTTTRGLLLDHLLHRQPEHVRAEQVARLVGAHAARAPPSPRRRRRRAEGLDRQEEDARRRRTNDQNADRNARQQVDARGRPASRPSASGRRTRSRPRCSRRSP